MLELAPEDQAQIDAAAKVLRAVQTAMPLGILMFAGVACFIGATHPAATDADDVPTILSGLHAMFAVGCCVAAVIVPRVPIKQLPSQASLAVILSALRSGTIIRLALLEGAALMGLCTLMVAGTGGQLAAHPVLYANLLTSVAFVGFAFGTLPNRDDLRERVHRIRADAALAMDS